jgi:osmotically-inducible protein OsmY
MQHDEATPTGQAGVETEIPKHGALGHLSADEELQQAVCAALIESPGLNSAKVGVQVANGTVILSGSVPTQEDRRAALRLAHDQPGVVAVEAESLSVAHA